MEINRVYAVIMAAGKGSRMGIDTPKQLMPYEGMTVLGTAVSRFACSGLIDKIIIVSPEDGSLDGAYSTIVNSITDLCECSIDIINGGAERQDSVRAGLRAALADASGSGADPSETLVLIHDAARPGVDEQIIRTNIEAAAECGAVVTAMPAIDSIRMILPEKSPYMSDLPLKESITYPIMYSTVVERDLVYYVQTPQTFRLSDIMAAYELAYRDGYFGTDDASIAERAGIRVAIVPGSPANSKITYFEDIPMTTRVGTGYDVHRLVPGRALILCGTPVPYEKGLLGHSDADVATHALMDALLGAAGLGDIGRHFPDNDPEYEGADSLGLLARVKDMLGDAKINNVDITIIAQAPKLSPYSEQMHKNISETLGIPASAVNIKATTEEGLGFTGRGEGIAAIATCAIEGRFV